MPGHVKKTDGPDPCPDQWLIVSEELSIKLKSKPYDAKKSCWVPNKGTGGFDEGLIQSTSGDGAKTQITVKVLESGEVSLRKVNSLQEAYAKCFAVHILKFEILQTT